MAAQLKFAKNITKVILDIEGTICPISFVHDTLFPYFVGQIDPVLSSFKFPLSAADSGDSEILKTLKEFPLEHSKTESALSSYIKSLVASDVKDPVLKKLQGFIWLNGYESGELSCPIYQDAIDSIISWAGRGLKVYIYSSGSVKLQKLLLKYNKSKIDLNQYVSDYFDTVNIGSKLELKSYDLISDKIGGGDELLFLSDNVLELQLATKTSGINTCLVVRPGNKPAEYELKTENFTNLF